VVGRDSVEPRSIVGRPPRQTPNRGTAFHSRNVGRQREAGLSNALQLLTSRVVPVRDSVWHKRVYIFFPFYFWLLTLSFLRCGGAKG
jgi:hypothetical protein